MAGVGMIVLTLIGIFMQLLIIAEISGLRRDVRRLRKP
jgi:uncharacterized integral membrane protein